MRAMSPKFLNSGPWVMAGLVLTAIIATAVSHQLMFFLNFIVMQRPALAFVVKWGIEIGEKRMLHILFR